MDDNNIDFETMGFLKCIDYINSLNYEELLKCQDDLRVSSDDVKTKLLVKIIERKIKKKLFFLSLKLGIYYSLGLDFSTQEERNILKYTRQKAEEAMQRKKAMEMHQKITEIEKDIPENEWTKVETLREKINDILRKYEDRFDINIIAAEDTMSFIREGMMDEFLDDNNPLGNSYDNFCFVYAFAETLISDLEVARIPESKQLEQAKKDIDFDLRKDVYPNLYFKKYAFFIDSKLKESRFFTYSNGIRVKRKLNSELIEGVTDSDLLEYSMQSSFPFSLNFSRIEKVRKCSDTIIKNRNKNRDRMLSVEEMIVLDAVEKLAKSNRLKNMMSDKTDGVHDNH